MRWVGKIVSPSCSVGTITASEPRALLRAVLVVVGEGRLVAVVAVGDQQLRVGEDAGRIASRGARAGCARPPAPPRPRSRRPAARAGRRRAGRSARRGRVELEAGAVALPSARRACARAAGRRRLRTAPRAASTRVPRASARLRPALRSPAPATSRPGSSSRTSVPSPSHADHSRAASASPSASVRWTTLYGLAARYRARASASSTSYGGATSDASGPARRSS